MIAITEADFAAHLRWCQNPEVRGDWTRDDDLRLAEGLVRDGLEPTAARLPSSCRARWNTLYPAEIRGIREQEILLTVLRRQAGRE